MHLQEIIDQLDAELDRLTAIRTLVVGLGSPSVVPVRRFRAESAAAPPVELESREEPVPHKHRTWRPRKLRVPHTLPTPVKAVREPTALNGAVPSGPVVVSVAALVRERESRATIAAVEKPEAETTVQGHTLDALSLNLAARWLMGAA